MSINSNTESGLLHKIKMDFPGFNEDEILDYTQFVVPNMHFLFKN